MQTKNYVLGIDTSNYTTSVAVVNHAGEIICDIRKPLKVKEGEIGLRQSHAFFQHVETFPELIEKAMKGENSNIKAIAVSDKPRQYDFSYMPTFKAGESIATSIAHALNVPIFKFSHQEGHVEAVKYYSSLKDKTNFLCYHLSGGTNELLKVTGDEIKIIGATKDISFGQVLDRLGVMLDITFPCGAALDEIALNTEGQSKFLKAISIDGLNINLSGIETQAARTLLSGITSDEKQLLVKEIFNNMANVLIKLTEKAVIQTDYDDVLFVGGVSGSEFLSSKLHAHFEKSSVNLEFGDQKLSSDNAVGIALLGRKKLWQ